MEQHNVNLKNTQLFELRAPVVLVTGAARRIGAAIALYLHQAGYRLVYQVNDNRMILLVVAVGK